MQKSYRLTSSGGFTLMELMVVVGIISILSVIAVPAYNKYRKRALNTSAYHSGEVAKAAQERYYNRNQTYSNQLSELLTVDHNITTDPMVTFTFRGANSDGYTYLTSHSRGNKEWSFVMKP
jgi:prepilin-type N-terminal cleavage/methylation domain-containing protein